MCDGVNVVNFTLRNDDDIYILYLTIRASLNYKYSRIAYTHKQYSISFCKNDEPKKCILRLYEQTCVVVVSST